MDWIHCNECFAQPNNSASIALFLTSCGHIFCGECRTICADDETCRACKSRCSFVQLVQDLDPNIKDYFTEPKDILYKLQKVLKFQKQHRIRLTAHRVALEAKYKHSKLEIKRMVQIIEKMQSDMVKLYKENRSLKNQLTVLRANSEIHSSLVKLNTPRPQLNQYAYSEGQRTSSAIERTFKLNQTFQSNLVTPLRVSRPNSTRNEYESRSSQHPKVPLSLLTPSSTASSSR